MSTPSAYLQALASNLLARAKDLATSEDLSATTGFQLSLMLTNTQSTRAIQLLKADAPINSRDLTEAISLLTAANEIIVNIGADDDDPERDAKGAAAQQMQAQVADLFCSMS